MSNVERAVRTRWTYLHPRNIWFGRGGSTRNGDGHRRGFTLTELLITVTILGILAGLIFTAINTARQKARVARTKATIAKLHTIVMERYESYARRRVSINTSGMTLPQARLTRLRALRDIMRMEMPYTPTDVTDGPKVSGLARPALSEAYLAKYNAGPPSTTYNVAEIFYMWVTMSNPEARAQFAEYEIGDTDGDGWPEFIDAWGNPIMFLRWAPGFLPANGADTQLQTGDPVRDHDPLDPYKVDSNAWRMTPLIYSAGPDGIYDIEVQAGYDGANPYAGELGKPKDLANQSRTAPGPANGTLDHYDNIHNHRLEVR
ncbi:MAG: prepilin-type N-terminal cleavage/methylation domain-containing protein [Thermoguttaceae bacterium]|nr:prepilin-type N-terminal cleavage/methylation domain-containing protein [Thermoguttaceae bacterium]MDW8038687.1 prepilin-type N-terminal cleavage/methylation domain-containing protein [Thermoguttaceae bacterium]